MICILAIEEFTGGQAEAAVYKDRGDDGKENRTTGRNEPEKGSMKDTNQTIVTTANSTEEQNPITTSNTTVVHDTAPTNAENQSVAVANPEVRNLVPGNVTSVDAEGENVKTDVPTRQDEGVNELDGTEIVTPEGTGVQIATPQGSVHQSKTLEGTAGQNWTDVFEMRNTTPDVVNMLDGTTENTTDTDDGQNGTTGNTLDIDNRASRFGGHQWAIIIPGPLLLTWFNLNPSMDK